jgi:energy-coupling factor transport system substrate-specific component
VASRLQLPLFLDSIGTAIVAAIMGPFVGAISGVLFNIISSLIGGNVMASLFGLCNLATAFIVGFMVRFGYFRTVLHAIIATVAVGMANAMIGAPIAVVVYGVIQGSGVDLAVAGLLALGHDILSAAFLARVPINLVDKGIAVIIAWLILLRLPENMKNLAGSKLGKAGKEVKASEEQKTED